MVDTYRFGGLPQIAKWGGIVGTPLAAAAALVYFTSDRAGIPHETSSFVLDNIKGLAQAGAYFTSFFRWKYASAAALGAALLNTAHDGFVLGGPVADNAFTPNVDESTDFGGPTTLDSVVGSGVANSLYSGLSFSAGWLSRTQIVERLRAWKPKRP